MTNEELQKITEEVSDKYFGRPFEHKAFFNNRLRTTGGRYSLQDHSIEINPKQLTHFGEEDMISIIKHELCHYHLHLQGKGYQHKDRDFKQLLQQVGGSRHCRTLPGSRNQTRFIHEYGCRSCGAVFRRRRQVNTKRYVCGKCKGRLEKTKSLSLNYH